MRLASRLAAAALLIGGASAAFAQADETLKAFENRYSKAIEAASKVVVSIKVDRLEDDAQKPPRIGGFFSGTDFAVRPEGPVSGFIVEADGLIATTYFNIQGKLREPGVEVTLPDGTVHEAKVLGWNVGADIAVLKIDAKNLPTLKAADPAEFRAGDIVVAIGRDPSGRGTTANPGILSAAGRNNGRTIQVDARLNYGNVGGPLVDLEGRLVGMTCRVNMASAGERGQNSGVSYVMVVNKILEQLPSLRRGDRIKGGGGRPFLGVMGDQNFDGKGARLERILSGGSAEKAGLKDGDIIVELNGVAITKFDDLKGEILKHKIGDTVKIKVRRDQDILDYELPLGENPTGE